MKVLDLFSGIGGFSLGLERAGMTTEAFCEIDPYCRQILARHWPGIKIHHDVTKLDGAEYAGAVDLICGGYPCQPFSEAGRKQGESDPRHLWPEMHRIIREARPRWVVAENVRGHISLGFDTVAAYCTSLRRRRAPQKRTALDFGLLQTREIRNQRDSRRASGGGRNIAHAGCKLQ